MKSWMLMAAISLMHPIALGAEPLVVFQSLHNLNYAKSVCEVVLSQQRNIYESRIQSECALAPDPRALGRRLEVDIMSSFAGNHGCAAVTIVRAWDYDYDKDAGRSFLAAQMKEHWDLLLDFMPDSERSGWSIFLQDGKGNIQAQYRGEGTASQIADAVCAIVQRQGATIR